LKKLPQVRKYRKAIGEIKEKTEEEKEGVIPIRNRYLVVCSKFYKWLIHNYKYSENPFAGLKQKKEVHNHDDIVYAKKEETKYFWLPMTVIYL
jgi:site-specific recombinase XerD